MWWFLKANHIRMGLYYISLQNYCKNNVFTTFVLIREDNYAAYTYSRSGNSSIAFPEL